MKSARFWISVLSVAGIMMIGTGCSEDESDSGLMGLTSPSSSLSSTAWVPDVSEMESVLKMTPEQKTQMEAALKSFRGETESVMQQDRQRGGHGSRGHGPGACSAGDADIPAKDSPFFSFIEEAADILEPGQFVVLAKFMAERRDEHREQMTERRRGSEGMHGRHSGHGKPHCEGHDGMLDRMAEELGLTDEQRAQVEEAAEAMHEQCRESGEDRAECREQGRELHDQFRAQLETILTAEQLEQLEDLHNERREERGEHREARMEVRTDRMLGLLTKVLDLTPDQVEQIRSIHEDMAEEHQALRDQIHSGEVNFEDIREQMGDRRDEIHQAVRDILTPDQQEVFDALADLLPHHGPKFGHGFGRGCGGSF